MEILDPDLWNDDGTPKRPSKEYMDGLAVIQAHADGLMRVVDTTTPVAATEKQIVDSSFMNFARIKRDTKAQRPPEIGDIVHGWDHEHGVCRAAIVMETESFNHNCELRVHIPRKPYEDWYANHDEHKEGAGEGTWHWPCGEGQ
jgi:hypothetical protein